MIKVLLIYILLTQILYPAPPSPHSFATQDTTISQKILLDMIKGDISNGIDKMITVWNKDYPDPKTQMVVLMRVYKELSNSPKMPRQLLLNETYQLKKVINTKRMIDALDALQKQLDITHHVLFDYLSILAKTKDGNINRVYSYLLKEMPIVVSRYNSLAKVTNIEYKRVLLPYYRLDRN